jgi:flagellar basal body rod protein FlgG
MPLRGIVNTARSLSYALRLQEVTANNLANSRSDAFKADRVAAHAHAGSDAPVPVHWVDLEQGTMRDTGRALDVALDGPGFLVVRTARGERLTRGGSLQLDGESRLVDAHGDPLLGAEGRPIVLGGAEVEIGADGSIATDGRLAGRLLIATVADPTALLKEGAGRFVPAEPIQASTADDTRVRQGAVEDSNLDPLLSMVDLITIQRAFSANLEALRAMDSVLGVVTGQVGKP